MTISGQTPPPPPSHSRRLLLPFPLKFLKNKHPLNVFKLILNFRPNYRNFRWKYYLFEPGYEVRDGGGALVCRTLRLVENGNDPLSSFSSRRCTISPVWKSNLCAIKFSLFWKKKYLIVSSCEQFKNLVINNQALI